MKTSLHYDLVAKLLDSIERTKNNLCDGIMDDSLSQMMSKYIHLRELKGELKSMQASLFEVATIDEIKAIVSEAPIDDLWGNPSDKRFNRQALPKDIYCDHRAYQANPKLQALMPNKRFT